MIKLLKKSILGEIPTKWTRTKLQTIVKSHNAGIYKKRDLYGKGVNIVGVSNLYDNNSINGQIFNKVPLTEEECIKFTLQEGDFIYGESSLVKEGIARTLYVSKRGEGTAFAWHTRRFTISKDTVDPQFLNFLLNSTPLRRCFISLATQTALTGITTNEFFGVEITYPKLSEQRKIAEILSTVDDSIEKTDRIIAETKQLKKGLMQKLFTEGIGHTRFKDTKIGRIPEEWGLGQLNDISIIIMGQSPPGNTYNADGVGTPLLNGPTEFTDYSPIPIQFTTQETKLSKKGDILLCVRGSSTGRMNISDQQYCIGRGIGAIRAKSNSHTKFIYYILVNIADRLLKEAKDMGSTFPNINKMDLNNKPIAIPSITEQIKIAKILSEVDVKIEKEQATKDQLEYLKKGLLQVLLTGQIGVKV